MKIRNERNALMHKFTSVIVEVKEDGTMIFFNKSYRVEIDGEGNVNGEPLDQKDTSPSLLMLNSAPVAL